MARLIHLTLEIGRLETNIEIDRQPVDLTNLVGQVIAQIGPQSRERNIAVSLEADAPLPLVEGDEDRLRQVFLNLVDNAVKYARPGDRVVVSIGATARGIQCAVRDSGPGIPAKHLPHLTHRFYRAAAEELEGTGLGLTLVEAILRRHHSDLEIESHVDGPETGTCVRFLLPIFGCLTI